MISLSTSGREQLDRYLSALFLPEELVELRFIESWNSRGGKKSRVARSAQWLRPRDILAQYTELTSFAHRSWANIYCGVCPRDRDGDSRNHSIVTIRCVWCDMDHVTTRQAEQRWRDAGVSQPSLVVRSGSGIHGYWLLDRDLRTAEQRSQLLRMLPHFYRSFGGDHVQNLSRVLRLPGTMNFKDARFGRTPVPCVLPACDETLRYPLEAFGPWIELAEREVRAQRLSPSSGPSPAASQAARLGSPAEVMQLVSRLDRSSMDRSRRDFAIVCDLLQLGLAKEEIWELVSGRSKFQSNGRPYFDVTFSNAERRVRVHQMPSAQTRARS